MRARWIRALILVVVLVGGVITPVAPVGDAQAAGPSGFVTIPDANVHEDLPVDQSLPISKEDLEGSVMVSDNASTTEIVVTTSERAEGYLDNGTSVGGGSLALVIQDDTNHAGREVAIPADAVEGAIGRIPEAVHGTHEDGSEWTSQVRAQSGLLIFEVPHFSSNTVTFSGEVTVSGSFSDGSSVAYDLSSVDSVSNYSINVTGHATTEWDNQSATGLSPGSSTSLSVAGNAQPTGPADGEPRVTVSPMRRSVSGPSGGDSSTTGQINTAYSTTFYVSESSDTGTSTSVDYAISVEGGSTLATGSITVNGGGSAFPDSAAATETLDTDVPDSSNIVLTLTSNTANHEIESFEVESFYPSSVSVSTGSDSATVTTGTLSSSASVPLDIQTTDTTLTTSFTDGKVDVDIALKEQTKTVDPAVEVNGKTTSYSGVLSDGSTQSLSANTSWVQSGTNTINVSVGTGTLSADAPTPKVGLNYRHKATDEIALSYSADGWTERYNASRTFASTQESPTVTLPFQGTITEITRLEERTDGGSWSSVPSSRYSLDGSQLSVQLDDGDGDGNVDAGTNMSVRVTGRHVRPVNGAITVTDPILPGEDADVEFRINSKSSGFYVDLSGVSTPGVRYTYQESWSNPDSHMIVTASGEKRLKFPNAPEGGSARVTLIPLTVAPETGEAKVSVADPDEPTISLEPGATDGDDVTIRYLEASTGTTYQLYSTSRDRIVAKEEANAGVVSFVEDDSAESLMINTSSSGGGGGGMFGDASTPADYGTGRPVLVMGTLAALVIGLVWATGRTGIRGRQRWVLVGGVSLALGLLSLESLNPGSISRFVGESLGSVLPLAGIAAVVIVGYTVVSWWQSRKKDAATPETKVTFSLGDRKK
ncbi:serine-rich family protein [Haloplanus natans]|uniref:hypothetical protein n=1 Tax=Haloplanus natans TaxID=376171 RepID=UPI000677FBC9|nr:hypothetical protein [Haloplanus natans]